MILHPLLAEMWREEHNEDINQASPEKLHEKISQLNKRMIFARSMGNFQVVQQMQGMVDDLYSLASDRMRADAEKNELERQRRADKARKEAEN